MDDERIMKVSSLIQSVDDGGRTDERASEQASEDIKVSQWCARREKRREEKRREEGGERLCKWGEGGGGDRGLPGPDQISLRQASDTARH